MGGGVRQTGVERRKQSISQGPGDGHPCGELVEAGQAMMAIAPRENCRYAAERVKLAEYCTLV